MTPERRAALEAELAKREKASSKTLGDEVVEFFSSAGAGAASPYTGVAGAATGLTGQALDDPELMRASQQLMADRRPEDFGDRLVYDAAAGMSAYLPFALPQGPAGIPNTLFAGLAGMATGQADDALGLPGALATALIPTEVTRRYLQGVQKINELGQTTTGENIPLSAEELKRSEELSEMGIPTLRSDLTGDLEDIAEEAALAGNAKSMGVIIDKRIEQSKGILNRLEKIAGIEDIKQVNPVAVVSRLAKSYQEGVKNTYKAFTEKANKLYSSLPSGTVPVSGMVESLAKMRETSYGNERVTNYIEDFYTRLADNADEAGNIDIKTLWNMKKELSDFVYKGASDPDSPFFNMDFNTVKNIQLGIINSIYKTVGAAAEGGNKAAQKLQSANKFYREGLDKINTLRTTSIEKTLGADNFKALFSEDPKIVMDALLTMPPKQAKMLAGEFKSLYPNKFAQLRRAAFDQAFAPFMTEIRDSSGNVQRVLATGSMSPQAITDAFEKYPILFDGIGSSSDAAKKLGRFMEKADVLFKGAERVGRTGDDNLASKGLNLLADVMGTAAPRDQAYRLRYSLTSISRGLNFLGKLRQDPRVFAQMAANPRYQRAYMRIATHMRKNKDGTLTPTDRERIIFSPQIEKDVKLIEEMVNQASTAASVGMIGQQLGAGTGPSDEQIAKTERRNELRAELERRAAEQQ